MKRVVVLIVGSITFLSFAAARPASAICRVVPGQICPSNQFQRTYTLYDGGSAQCTSGTSATYNVCCDLETEADAADSVRAPICGSSQELGKANSSCWTCGSDYRCAGLSFGLDTTDDFVHRIRNPVNLGDTNTDQVWRIPHDQVMNNLNANGKFTYNGHAYGPPPGDLIVCNSNVLGCGASDVSCESTIYGKDQQSQVQCTAYSYTRISLTPGSSPGTSGTVSTGGDKACINIGDYSSHFNELSRAADTFPNGWIYILALPEWMDSISAFIKDHPGNNFMIRLHHPNAELSPDYANRWVANLKTYAGNIPNKVYLMPVNEPNNSGDRRVEPNDARLFISALSQGLDNEGLLNTKYIVTSPMIDPTSSDVTGWLGDFCADGYCDQFAAVAVAPYDFTENMSDIKSYFPSTAPMIIAETGIKRGGEVVYGLDSETAGYITSQRDNWKNAVAACIFSYDPDRNTNQEWIYAATDTHQALLGLGQSIKPITAPQITRPKSVRSTISYESCTDTGTPDITTKVPIPNLANFGIKGADKQGKSFLAGLKSFAQRPISGILGFQGSKAGKPIVDEPSVYKSLGMQLDRALPFLTPLAIHVQPIVQEYFHNENSTLCFVSDNGNTQAFPFKERIIIPAPGLNKLLQNGRMLSGFIAPNVSISKYEYEHLGELNPYIQGSIQLKPECDEPPSARAVRKTIVPTSEAEEYDVPLAKLPIYFLDKWIDKARSIIGKFCTETDCDADANPSMYALMKIKTPKIKQILRDSTNDPTVKPVGSLATFVPGSFYFPNEHGKVTGQTIEQSVGSNSEDIKNVDVNFFGAKTIDIYDQFTNCALHPKALQKNLDYGCNFSDQQHGVQPVPTELSTAVSNIWRQRFPGESFDGILGQEFLKRYAVKLITTKISDEQRALLMTKISDLFNKYVTSGNWPNSQLASADYQQQIPQTASAYGLNEAFLYALWVEETHASSVGDYPFGCGGYTDFSASLNCIATDPTVQTYIRDPLPDALCMYADGHRNCTFEAHPNFVRNLMYYYDYLTNP